MSSSVLYMSMSLDGFIAGPNETVDHGLGDGGMRLHQWFFPNGKMDPARLTGANRQISEQSTSSIALTDVKQLFYTSV